MTLRELGEKDVIQIRTGEKLGRIDDVIFDEKNAALQLRGAARARASVRADGVR